VVVDECGEVLQLEGDPGVRRRRSIEECSSSEGANRRGGRTVVTRGQSSARGRGSGGRKPTRRTLGRWGRMRGARAWTDETNGARGEKIFRPTGGGSVLTESGGEGAWRGGRCVEVERERERGGWRGVEQRGRVASVRQQPDRGARGRHVAARQWRAAGSA
jgi:hypothetical protein